MQTKSSEVIDYLTPLLLSGLIWYNPCENELVARNICKDKTLHLVIIIITLKNVVGKNTSEYPCLQINAAGNVPFFLNREAPS